MTLAGCATMTGIGATDTERQLQRVCILWTGVSWSTKDTDQTIVDVKVNNAKRDAFCAAYGPAKK